LFSCNVYQWFNIYIKINNIIFVGLQFDLIGITMYGKERKQIIIKRENRQII